MLGVLELTTPKPYLFLPLSIEQAKIDVRHPGFRKPNWTSTASSPVNGPDQIRGYGYRYRKG